VASTVVLLRALEARHNLGSTMAALQSAGLIVEDLMMVPHVSLSLALAQPLGGQILDEGHGTASGNLWVTLGFTLGKVVVFVALMLLVGVRLFPWLLERFPYEITQ
jgi:CPA2 family monovalent cation:H+ antiporter-2